MTTQARTVRLISLTRWIAVLVNTALVVSTAVALTQIAGDSRSALVARRSLTIWVGLADFPASIPGFMLARTMDDRVGAMSGMSAEASRASTLAGCLGLLGGLQYYGLGWALGWLLFGREKTVAWTWKTRTTTGLVGLLLMGAAAALPWSMLPRRLPGAQIAFAGASRTLQHTVIVPTLDTPIPEGNNAIWCATFQMAWDRMKTDVIGGPIRVAKAEAVAERLNRMPVAAAELPDDSYYAAAGRMKDGIIEKIREEMARRFQKEPFDLEREQADLVAYAYLRAGVPFTLPYSDNDEDLHFTDTRGRRTRVATFGIQPRDGASAREVRGQVEILYAERQGKRGDPTEFALDLCRDSQPSQLVLACLARKATLQATIEDLDAKTRDSKLKLHERQLSSSSQLLIPSSYWRIAHHFGELEGADKRLLNRGFEDLFIGYALQDIDFRLDREGVRLESQSAWGAAKSSKSPAPDFRFDRPFLILLKKRGAPRPFFAMWVDNAELLCKPVSQPKDQPQ